MNKELSPLEAVKKIREINYFEDDEEIIEDCFGLEEYLSIIETALKDYEELTSKPAILCGRTHGHTKKLIDTICKNYKEVKITNLEDEKKLKAFDVVSDKICVDFFAGLDNEYVYVLKLKNSKDFVPITQEEYDLLKEVLL